VIYLKNVGNIKIAKEIKKQMMDGGLDDASQQTIFNSIYQTRQKFVEMLETIRQGSTAQVMLPTDVKKNAWTYG
jgi:hypothetical protein